MMDGNGWKASIAKFCGILLDADIETKSTSISLEKFSMDFSKNEPPNKNKHSSTTTHVKR